MSKKDATISRVVGERIRQLRKESELKQDELGEKIGVNRVTISNYEKAERSPSYEVMVKIAQYFKVPLGYFFQDVLPEEEQQSRKISDTFKALRLQKGLSQQELAEKLNIAQTSIGNYERGEREPDYTVMLKYITHFNVSADYLFGHTDTPTSDHNDTLTKQLQSYKEQLQQAKDLLENIQKLIL